LDSWPKHPPRVELLEAGVWAGGPQASNSSVFEKTLYQKRFEREQQKLCFYTRAVLAFEEDHYDSSEKANHRSSKSPGETRL
jgi:hypothetical protein